MTAPTQLWRVRPADDAAADRIARELELPRALARVLVLRGYGTPDQARRFLSQRDKATFLEVPLTSPNVERAVARVRGAIAAQEPMVIYGDYDCDGVTSTTVLYRYLKNGLKANVRAYLPDRFRDGYGVTAAAVERLAKEGTKLILTCDNGISAVAAAAKARECGVDLIVTDHHTPPAVLPDALAIVHPTVDFPELALHDLAGVGVAFMFILAMEGGWTSRMEFFLDTVAIGTIADVVPLNGPNRPLVWAGLERIRDKAARKRNAGIDALLRVAKRDPREVTARDVGFLLGPRINAAGRLETPDVGFQLLTSNDLDGAMHHAQVLDQINQDRRELSSDLEAQVYDLIDRTVDVENEPFIVLHDDFHHGITGIVAGRVKERYRVPVLLFSGGAHPPTPDRHGATLKGSGRSPEGCHLYDALHANRHLLEGYGGHAQAAGCAVKPDQLDALRKGLNDHLRASGWTRPEDLVELDVVLPFREANADLLEHLQVLEPCGQKNPAPVFGLLQAKVVSKKAFGGLEKRHLELYLDDGETVARVIAWNEAHRLPELGDWVNLVYDVRPNTYQGRTELQVVARRVDPALPPSRPSLELAGVQVEVTVPEPLPVRPTGPAQVVDRRGDDVKLEVVAGWREGDGLYLGGYLHGAGTKPVAALVDREADVAVLDALDAPVDRLWCLGVPRDEATWARLLRSARELVAAWPVAPEEALGEPALQAVYRALHVRPGERFARVPLPPTVPGAQAADARSILAEAGVLLAAPEGDPWKLLAAPEDVAAIALDGLSAYRAHLSAVAFRNRLRTGDLAAMGSAVTA